MRHFFIVNPREISVEGAPQQEIELDLHPDSKKGGRKFLTHEAFLITQEDYEQFEEGKLYRLMDCLNFVIKDGKYIFHSLDYETYKKEGAGIIHWLPQRPENVCVEVVMPDGAEIAVSVGAGEEHLMKLNVGDVVQLERFGFCRLDFKSDEKLVFWFAHK